MFMKPVTCLTNRLLQDCDVMVENRCIKLYKWINGVWLSMWQEA